MVPAPSELEIVMPQHFHAVVWIDHRAAQIFDFDKDETNRQVIKSHEPRHIHHKAGSIGAGHEHEGQIYLKAVADAAGASHEILIVGPGAAKTELMSYLTQHAPETAKRVCGVEALDHPTDNEIVAFARKHFTGIDRMRPQTDV
jgi:stalled ribosome rescue protein Dom34